MALVRDGLGGDSLPQYLATAPVEAEDKEVMIGRRRRGPLIEARIGRRRNILLFRPSPGVLDSEHEDAIAPDGGRRATTTGQGDFPLDVGLLVPFERRIGGGRPAGRQRPAP